MGHKRPKGLPPDWQKITDKQFTLLADVLIRNHRDGELVPVIWSPKKFLGRSPTRGESSAMSTRLKTLINQGLVRRYGRELLVTELGQRVLWVNAKNRAQTGDLLARAVVFFTEMLEAKEERDAFATAVKALMVEPISLEKRLEINRILLSAAASAAKRAVTAGDLLKKVVQEYIDERNKEL
jgi:hypothetical protein